jgi:hypothetical protein
MVTIGFDQYDVNMEKHFKIDKLKNYFKMLEKSRQDINSTVQPQENTEKLISCSDDSKKNRGPSEFWSTTNGKINLGPSIKAYKPWGPGSNPSNDKKQKLKPRKNTMTDTQKQEKLKKK